MTDMAFDAYQTAAHQTAIYPPENGLQYLVAGLAGEAGEVAGKAAKYFRGDKELNRDDMVKELGDVLWFVSELAFHLGVPLSEIAQGNIRKLAKRKAAGTLQGDGDNR